MAAQRPSVRRPVALLSLCLCGESLGLLLRLGGVTFCTRLLTLPRLLSLMALSMFNLFVGWVGPSMTQSGV